MNRWENDSLLRALAMPDTNKFWHVYVQAGKYGSRVFTKDTLVATFSDEDDLNQFLANNPIYDYRVQPNG